LKLASCWLPLLWFYVVCVCVYFVPAGCAVLPLMKTLSREYNGHWSPTIPINATENFPSPNNKRIEKGNSILKVFFFVLAFFNKRILYEYITSLICHGKERFGEKWLKRHTCHMTGTRFWCILSICTGYFTLENSR